MLTGARNAITLLMELLNPLLPLMLLTRVQAALVAQLSRLGLLDKHQGCSNLVSRLLERPLLKTSSLVKVVIRPSNKQ